MIRNQEKLMTFDERLVRALKSRMLKTTQTFQVELSDNVILQLIDAIISTKLGIRWNYSGYERESQSNDGTFRRFESLVFSAPGVKTWITDTLKEFITDDLQKKARKDTISSLRARYEVRSGNGYLNTPKEMLDRELDSVVRHKAWQLAAQHGVRDARKIFDEAIAQIIGTLERPSVDEQKGK